MLMLTASTPGAPPLARTFSHAWRIRRFEMSNDFTFGCDLSISSCPSGVAFVRSGLHGSFAPARLPGLRHYYEPSRPCASRYSAPRGFCRLESSLFAASRPGAARPRHPPVSRRQVLLFHASACDELTPPLHRAPPGPHAGRFLAEGAPARRAFVPGTSPSPGFDADFMSFDASAVVHARSSSRRAPDPVSPGLFRDAHHSGSLPPQLPVFWLPPRTANPEGHILHHWHSTVRAGDLLHHHHSPFKDTRTPDIVRAVKRPERR